MHEDRDERRRGGAERRLPICRYIWWYLNLTNGMMPIEQRNFYTVNIYWKKKAQMLKNECRYAILCKYDSYKRFCLQKRKVWNIMRRTASHKVFVLSKNQIWIAGINNKTLGSANTFKRIFQEYCRYLWERANLLNRLIALSIKWSKQLFPGGNNKTHLFG